MSEPQTRSDDNIAPAAAGETANGGSMKRWFVSVVLQRLAGMARPSTHLTLLTDPVCGIAPGI